MKKNLTIEERLHKYTKRFRVTLAILVTFILLTGFYLYLNYDYLVFKHFIAHNYIYTDALDKVFEKELGRDVKGKYFTYFDDLVISTVTSRIREENDDRYTYLFIPEQYVKYKQEEKDDALQSQIKVLNDKTVYLYITNFSKYTEKFVYDNLKQLKVYPNLILDLRDNYGGDIAAMNRIADLFLPKGSIIATDKMRIMDWTYKARGGKKLAYSKIIILQNKNTASAAENLITSLKDNLSNVYLVGETTYGKGIGQYTLPLKKGFAVKATTLLWYTPNNVNIQGKGINPDIKYTGNDAVQYALSLLGS
jgi:C-terminal processing protease CtpA/Prc